MIVSSVMLLTYARDSILSLNIEQAHSRQSSLISSFTEMAKYYLNEDDSPVVKASGVKYCFERFADETSVLMRDGEILYSSIIFDPSEFLPPVFIDDLLSAGDSQVILTEISDRNILIGGSSVIVLGDRYNVYTVKDITGVYNDIAKLTWRFVAISTVSIIVGAVLIVLLVRGATKPLMTLKKTTRRIAVGEYGQRVDIRTSDEAGELAKDFNDMAEAVQSHIDQLNETAQRQQEFIGGLTHELKTPMASMVLHTDTLLTADLTSAEARNSLIHLHEQCLWMERLSQKLLKLITLEQDLQLNPERIKGLFDDVQDSMAETLSERNTPLIVDCEIDTITIDYDLMKSLLINLIDNASKASTPGQDISLRAHNNSIEVSDQGSGIPPEDISRVTDAFYMVDRSRAKTGSGSGLGLALVKRIADAHRAELIIDSEPLVGTTVRVVFNENSIC